MATEQVLLALQRAAHRTYRLLGEQATGLPLNPAELGALVVLHDRGDVSVAELNSHLQFARSTLSSVLDRLAERDLVVRQVHPEDKRTYLLELSDSGQQLAARAAAHVEQLEARVTGQLPAGAVEHFHEVIAAIEQEEQPA